MNIPKFSFTKYLRKLKREIFKQDWPGWDWDAGGCFAFAENFQKVFGGERFGICMELDEGDFITQHAMVWYEGYLFDAKGLVNTKKWMKGDICSIRHKDDENIVWFEDQFFDDRQNSEIEAILRGLKREFLVYISKLKKFDKDGIVKVQLGQPETLLVPFERE